MSSKTWYWKQETFPSAAVTVRWSTTIQLFQFHAIQLEVVYIISDYKVRNGCENNK
jgi:hypothetical protein